MSVVATITRLRKHRGPSNLENMAANLVNEVRDAMDDQIIAALRIMHTEPPPPPDSSYERTHRYSGSWEPVPPHRTLAGLVGGIKGDAVDERGHDYTVWVGGDSVGTGQQDQHAQTGWPLAALALAGISAGVAIQRGEDFVSRVRKAVQRSKR
jgi:hypothetical protein